MNRSTFRYTTDQRTGHQGGDWRERGLCRDDDPEKWFPVGTSGPAAQQAEEAKAICRRCPVKDECLDWGIDAADFGIWGGLDEDERRALRYERKRGEARR